LQPEGKTLLCSLVEPLQRYLKDRDELLMVSGFTDDIPIYQYNYQYGDNWELSAQRALTVTRALIEEGLHEKLIFAAAFGENHPVASNLNEQGRMKNRRVEIAPVPKATSTERHQ
jgi:flagellar motor protein MotB